MCNHGYKANYKQLPRGMGQRCPYPEFYAAARAAGWSELELPIDDTGKCIFHSPNVEWKRRNSFAAHFLSISTLLIRDLANAKHFDFAEFTFVGDAGSGGDVASSLRISDLVFPRQVFFVAASFHDPLVLERVDFEHGADFRYASFERDLRVLNSHFNGLDLAHAELAGPVLFIRTRLESLTSFHRARFTCSIEGWTVKFEDSQFDTMTDFSHASFILGSESNVGFAKVRFDGFVDFSSTQFRSRVVFGDVCFSASTDFVGTSFEAIDSSVRRKGCAVEFNQIEVSTNAVLTFKGASQQRKLFEDDVQMSFREDPVGSIHFENVNFNKIGKTSRDRLIRLTKFGHIHIGSGCLKYRFQTVIRTLALHEGNMPLVVELCQTFVNYFTVSNGLNLGFEIVERDASKLSFFYFTDEDISEEIFRDRLTITEQRLWGLLSIRSDEQLREQESQTPQPQHLVPEDAVVNALDGITAMFGTFFRAGIRIARGAWRESDTKALLGAIQFNEDGADSRAQDLHRVLVDKYTGLSLLGINAQQNVGLPPMIAPGGPVVDIAILTAIDVERQAVCRAFGLGDEHRVQRGRRVYWRGSLSTTSGEVYQLVVAQALDAASIDTALLANDLLHHWRPATALLVGIAATANPTEVRLGDVVIGSEVYYYERGKVTSEGTISEPKIVSADATLLGRVIAVSKWEGRVGVARPDDPDGRPKVHRGVIASGEKVIADSAARNEIAGMHRNIKAIEMEGYGFSRAIWQSFEHVRHLDIRAICDDGSQSKNDSWHAYAAAAAASFAKHLLLDLPLDSRGSGPPG